MMYGKRFFVCLMLACILLICLPVCAQPLSHLWSQRFGDSNIQQYGQSVAVDASGNVLVTGYFMGTVNFGGGVLTSAGSFDIFVAKFDPTGVHLWSQCFGDANYQYGLSVTVDGSGNVLVTGDFAGTVDFGGGALTSAGGVDIFVAKFDPTGAHVWSQCFGDASLETGRNVAVDASGNVLVTGDFGGTVDFGGGPLTSAGLKDIFAVKFDPTGAHVWSQRFGDASAQYGRSVAVSASGNVLVTGDFQGSVDFGGGALTSAGSNDIFAAKFDPTGAHLWSQRFGDWRYQYGRSVTVDASGNVLLTGDFQGNVDFGGGTLTSAGNYDIFVAKFYPAGAHLWSQRFGDAGYDYGRSVAVGTSGNVLVTGDFEGTVDFGGGALTSAGSNDIFTAMFGPTGAHVWSQRFGDASSQYSQSVAVDTPGNVLVAGYFMGTVDFGGGALTSAGGDDIFVAKFSPPPIPALSMWGTLTLISVLLIAGLIFRRFARRHRVT